MKHTDKHNLELRLIAAETEVIWLRSLVRKARPYVKKFADQKGASLWLKYTEGL